MINLFLMAGLFIFLGVAIKYFKWYFLIAGYNTMSKKSKENVDIKGLGDLMAKFLFLLGVIALIGAISYYYEYILITTIAFLLYIPIIVLLVVQAQKFDNNNKENNKNEVKLAVGILIISMVFVTILFIYGSRSPKVSFENDKVIITGMYGTSINKDEIIEMTLLEKKPKILTKTNGFDLGSILKGNFKVEDYGVSKIYLHGNKPPFLLLRTDKKYYIINYKESEETEELYYLLKSKF